LALMAILITVGSALAFVVLFLNAGGREPVLAVKRDVAAGQTIGRDDITVVRVASDPGVKMLSSKARDEVIGRPATVDLLAGSLLVPGAVGKESGLKTGTAVVAIPTRVEEVPSPDLAAGDRVLLYRAPKDAGGDEPRPTKTLGEGRVFDVQSKDDSSSQMRVSVTVDQTLVPDIAAAIQADEIYMAMASNRHSGG
jgi:hypothetical protein